MIKPKYAVNRDGTIDYIKERADSAKKTNTARKPRQWTIAEIVNVRNEAKNASKIPPLNEVDDIPVRGYWDRINGLRCYPDSVVEFGVVGKRCYLTVIVMGEEYNVHVPDNDDWHWLKSALIKKDRSGAK